MNTVPHTNRLSFAQERLWFLDQMQPGNPVYNVFSAHRLSGAIDVAALERAVGKVVRRHDALRTTFPAVDGTPVQVVSPFTGFELPVQDAAGLDDEALLRRAVEEAARPFDLARGPLFRATLLRMAPDEHLLLTAMHHTVSDGWSIRVLFRELVTNYVADLQGVDAGLPELPIQYAEFAVWQREQLQGDVLRRHVAWWKQRLAGAPELIALPTDRPRPPTPSLGGGMVYLNAPRRVLDRLQALGHAEGASLYMVLLAAFQVLLARYSGTPDVVVGSPIAGRTRLEVENLIGFFVNMLVMRTDLRGAHAFRDVVRRVRGDTLGAYEHQDLPFERLVAELQPERSTSHSPLFQVTFTTDTFDAVSGESLPGLRVQSVEHQLPVAKFDLALKLSATHQGLAGSLVYSTDLFDRATAERMARHVERVLDQVAEDPDVPLDELELLDATERARMVDEWNRTDHDFARDACLHEGFEAQVRATPDAVALVWDDERLTYAELDARASRLAHHLVRQGVGADAPVGVLLERGVDLVVSLLAILKAGGGYVPLDPAYPAERLRMMLDDSGARVLVTRGDRAGGADAAGVHVVCLDAAADAIAGEPAEGPRGRATALNLAYVVYTSGSTGIPKGVMVSHRNVVQRVTATDYIQLGPGDRIAQASNASFDALAFEVWGALLNGATLVGIPRDVLLSAPALRALLREQGITTIFQTTALFNQLSAQAPDLFAPLRNVLFGGQAVDPDSVRRVLREGRPRRLLHVYGPTETTVWCLCHPVEAVAEDARTVPLGRPLGNQRVYVLDSARQPAPVGVPGEAYLGGAGVARGYLDRPALTAERFVPDPFSRERGARMYRTGDRMRWNAEGRLEFLGRLDAQVKIRGFRVEPGEIEAVLRRHPDVADCAVVPREDAPGELRMVAYVAGGADPDALRAHLRAALPEYMVPAVFVPVARIPLTPNGKLDVRALAVPVQGHAHAPSAPPREGLEAQVAAIWCEVLGVERVGREDGFFDIGGHSLLLARVHARLRESLGRDIAIVELFRHPTVAALAEHLGAGEEAAPTEGLDRAALRRARSGARRGGSDRRHPHTTGADE